MALLLPAVERCGIISWLTLAPVPFEMAFDAIEASIDREMVVNG
ncbi:hypothetical protein ACE10Z_36605 [Bradyrhizobium sp. Pha-3]